LGLFPTLTTSYCKPLAVSFTSGRFLFSEQKLLPSVIAGSIFLIEASCILVRSVWSATCVVITVGLPSITAWMALINTL
jgi:hypothetical protein